MFEDFLADNNKFVGFIVKELKYLKGKGYVVVRDEVLRYVESDVNVYLCPSGKWCMHYLGTAATGMGLQEAIRNWAVAFVFDGDTEGVIG